MYHSTTTSAGSAMQAGLAHGPTAAIARAGEAVIQLLRDGLDAMDDNRAAATACIQRAYALLENERNHSQAAYPDPMPGGLAPWQIRRVITFIDANLERPITNLDLAPTVRLSPHYVARAFKQTFGVTPRVYVYRRRLELAQRLMLMTNSPLCQIALSCGFADQAHFTRRFRLSTGATPHAWRRARVESFEVAA